MGDIASGITSFRKGLREGTKELDDTTAPTIDADQKTDNTDTPPKE